IWCRVLVRCKKLSNSPSTHSRPLRRKRVPSQNGSHSMEVGSNLGLKVRDDCVAVPRRQFFDHCREHQTVPRPRSIGPVILFESPQKVQLKDRGAQTLPEPRHALGDNFQSLLTNTTLRWEERSSCR